MEKAFTSWFSYGASTVETKPSYGYVDGKYRSPSSWWRSRVSYSSVSYGTSAQSRLQKAIHQLARTVNIVENSVGTGERSLSVAWSGSDQDFNHPTSNVIYLESRELTDKSASEDQAVIDSLTGRALMLSSMKRTMDLDSFEAFQNGTGEIHNLATPLWKAQELYMAKRSVVKDWVGFGPYFEVYEQNQVLSKFEAMQEYIDSNELNAEIFSQIAAWNLLAPSSPIEVPEEYQELMDSILEESKKPVDAQFNHALNLATQIRDAFPAQEQQPPDNDQQEGEGEGDGQQEGSDGQQEGSGDGQQEGEGDGQQGGNPGPSDGPSSPEFLDDKMFGKLLSSPSVKGVSTKPLSLSDESLKDNNPFNPSDYVNDHEGRVQYINSIGAIRYSTDSPTIKADYKEKVRELMMQIQAVKRVLSFRSTKATRWVHAKEEGDLDEGSLHKLNNSQIQNIWSQKTHVSQADVAICILVDESGSMGCDHRYRQVRDVAIILTEALKGLSGVHTMVLGHTGMVSTDEIVQYNNIDLKTEVLREGKDLVMRELYTKHHKNPYALMAIKAMYENLDGYAIEYAAKRLTQDYPQARQRVIIHLSDGEPCPTSVQQCRKAVDKAQKQFGVKVFAIGVDNAYKPEKGIELYGEGRNVVLPDVMGSMNVLTPFLKKTLSKI